MENGKNISLKILKWVGLIHSGALILIYIYVIIVTGDYKNIEYNWSSVDVPLRIALWIDENSLNNVYVYMFSFIYCFYISLRLKRFSQYIPYTIIAIMILVFHTASVVYLVNYGFINMIQLSGGKRLGGVYTLSDIRGCLYNSIVSFFPAYWMALTLVVEDIRKYFAQKKRGI